MEADKEAAGGAGAGNALLYPIKYILKLFTNALIFYKIFFYAVLGMREESMVDGYGDKFQRTRQEKKSVDRKESQEEACAR